MSVHNFLTAMPRESFDDQTDAEVDALIRLEREHRVEYGGRCDGTPPCGTCDFLAFNGIALGGPTL